GLDSADPDTGGERTVRRRLPFAATPNATLVTWTGLEVGGATPLTVGAVPTQTLDLLPVAAIDPWGNEFQYTVSANVPGLGSGPAPLPNAALLTPGGDDSTVGVYDSSANPIYTITSLGPNGLTGAGGTPPNNADDISVSRNRVYVSSALVRVGYPVDDDD
ncbi:MAG: hypothetical protein ACR2RL_13380, partial [Gammaproteobacteria bacterium]